MERGRKKKWILNRLTILFFGVMLIGTFWGRSIGDYFRAKVTVRQPEWGEVIQSFTIEVNGEKIAVEQRERVLVLPKNVVYKQNNSYYVYVLCKKTEVFGSYYVLEERQIEVCEEESRFLVLGGLKEEDYVAHFVPEDYETGERILPEFSES